MKKALISKNELRGPTNTEGLRVLEVVEVGQEFNIDTTNLEWTDCPDNVTGPDVYWYRLEDKTFKLLPTSQPGPETLTWDKVKKEYTQYYEWLWETEVWEKRDIV